MGVSSPTKLRLYALSGNKCAWKDCNQLLTNEKKVNSKISTYQVGKVAHIRAQSEGGPRYDPDYPEDKIHDIDNLILLWGNCHDRIDTIFYGRAEKELMEVLTTQSTTINLKDLGLNDRQISALEQMINQGEFFYISKYMKFFNVARPTASRDLNHLVKEGLIFKYHNKRNKKNDNLFK